MARKYNVYGSPVVDLDIKVIDLATPYIKLLANSFPQYFNRALKSTGWWLSQEIKKGIRSGAPGGEQYPALSGLRKSRRGRLYSGQPKQHLGRLARAVGYRYYSDSRRVVVGWLSKSAVSLGEKHEQGAQVAITPKMRRYFWASGRPISAGKTHITLPRRRTFGPIYRQKGPEEPKYIENKIWQYINEVKTKGGKSS